MSTNSKIVSAAFVVSLSLAWGIPSLSEYLHKTFFWRELSQNPELVTAFAKEGELSKLSLEKRPLLKQASAIPVIESNAAFSLLIKEDGSERVLFAKNEDKAFPIASLTKLMTSLVALQTYSLDQKIVISDRAVATEGIQGDLRVNETFTVRDLLYPLLMESSNDAAIALAEEKGEPLFMKLMNGHAEILHMRDTYFFNPTGLDLSTKDMLNVSSAKDLATLVRYLKDEKPEVFDILGLKEFTLKDASGKFHHVIQNTNEFLGDRGFSMKVLGGKTGYTEKADGCLVIILQSPNTKGYIVNVILGSKDRFKEMKTLIQFLDTGYVW